MTSCGGIGKFFRHIWNVFCFLITCKCCYLNFDSSKDSSGTTQGNNRPNIEVIREAPTPTRIPRVSNETQINTKPNIEEIRKMPKPVQNSAKSRSVSEIMRKSSKRESVYEPPTSPQSDFDCLHLPPVQKQAYTENWHHECVYAPPSSPGIGFESSICKQYLKPANFEATKHNQDITESFRKFPKPEKNLSFTQVPRASVLNEFQNILFQARGELIPRQVKETKLSANFEQPVDKFATVRTSFVENRFNEGKQRGSDDTREIADNEVKHDYYNALEEESAYEIEYGVRESDYIYNTIKN